MPNRVHPRFNSQRDGILLKEREYPEVQLAFQFPTGWNSTIFREPNKWVLFCFNSQRDGILSRYFAAVRACACFNSQRDGILLYRQTPRLVEDYSFNSQRDGILPFLFHWDRALPCVSIPNGMEFYDIGIKRRLDVIVFQFPTGWNSTTRARRKGVLSVVSIPNGMEFYSTNFAIFLGRKC